MNFESFFKNQGNCTDYQYKVLQWLGKTFIAETSKLLVMFLYFHYFSLTKEYLLAIILFWILRFNGGGLHCKTYWGCFLLSFIYMVFSIQLLPKLLLPKIFYICMLIICVALLLKIGPIASQFRKHLPKNILSHYKVTLFQILLLFFIIMVVLPLNTYLIIGFWVILIHTLQMGITFLMGGETSASN